MASPARGEERGLAADSAYPSANALSGCLLAVRFLDLQRGNTLLWKIV
jgi:hypothetical protein